MKKIEPIDIEEVRKDVAFAHLIPIFHEINANRALLNEVVAFLQPTEEKKLCCPKCNFKGTAHDTPGVVYFGEEYCGKPDCRCHTPQQNEWEKGDFEELKCPQCGLWYTKCVQLKSFISRVVGSERSKLKEMVEGMELEGDFDAKNFEYTKFGYDKAKSDILSKLEK